MYYVCCMPFMLGQPFWDIVLALTYTTHWNWTFHSLSLAFLHGKLTQNPYKVCNLIIETLSTHFVERIPSLSGVVAQIY